MHIKTLHEDDGTKLQNEYTGLVFVFMFVSECGCIRIHMGIVAPEEKKMRNGARDQATVAIIAHCNAIANNGTPNILTESSFKGFFQMK